MNIIRILRNGMLFMLSLNSVSSMHGQTQSPSAMVRIAEIEVHPNYVDQFQKIAQEVAQASVNLEPGVLCLYPAKVSGSENSFRVIEVYQDKSAYEAHLQTEHFKRYKAQSLPMVSALKLLDTQSIAPSLIPLIYRKDRTVHPLKELITVEEHFIIPSINKRVSDYLTAQNGGQPITTQAQRDLLKIILPNNDISDLGVGRLSYMDKSGVSMQILSYGAGGPQNLEDRKLALDLCREANDSLAQVVRSNPRRFAGLALLPMANVEDAVRELERSVRSLGLKGAMISGSPLGKHLDDASYRPIFAKAAELGVPLYLHPGAVPPAVASYYAPSDKWSPVASAMFATAGYLWHADSGIELIRLIMSGLFEEYPSLQVISGHWGELVPFYLNRLDDQQSKTLTLPKKISDYFRTNIYITPSGFFSEAQLKYVIETVGADRILYSTDYPFLKDDNAKQFLEEAQIAQTDKEQIAYKNAQKLFGL